jgi:hypothetical protein
MSQQECIAEYWRYKPTAMLRAVRLVNGAVIAAAGPLADRDLTDEQDTRLQLLRCLPYTERDARWVSRHRSDFLREPHHGQLGDTGPDISPPA